MHRRDWYRELTFLLGGVMGLVLAVPGVAYLLTPVLGGRAPRGNAAGGADAGFFDLARLSELTPGEPKSYPILADRWDAWVKYPREPVGSVWLVRQPEGATPPVVAFTAECPHLGCSVNLAGDGKSFLCPCHNSAFTLKGDPTNRIPPRPMDTLEVKLTDGDDPSIRVKFERFRTMAKEKTPLA